MTATPAAPGTAPGGAGNDDAAARRDAYRAHLDSVFAPVHAEVDSLRARLGNAEGATQDAEAPGGGAQEAATPGQAAYEAHSAATVLPANTWRWDWSKLDADQRAAWEAAAEAATARHSLSSTGALMGDIVALREQVRQAEAERDAAREELADAKAQLEYWPLCPDGCGCRIGPTGPDGENDADARDCACAGPCCMECRENGYPDAPSYRDQAVKHAVAGRDAALERVRSFPPRDGLDLSVEAAAMRDIARAALEATP